MSRWPEKWSGRRPCCHLHSADSTHEWTVPVGLWIQQWQKNIVWMSNFPIEKLSLSNGQLSALCAGSCSSVTASFHTKNAGGHAGPMIPITIWFEWISSGLVSELTHWGICNTRCIQCHADKTRLFGCRRQFVFHITHLSHMSSR